MNLLFLNNKRNTFDQLLVILVIFYSEPFNEKILRLHNFEIYQFKQIWYGNNFNLNKHVKL